MPFVPVPKDLTKVKTKIAFNLTKRQLFCFSLAAITGVPPYLFTRNILGNDVSAILMVTIMLPFFFFAMYERDGLPCEKVLLNIIKTKFIYPQTRPFKTENLYDSIEKQNKLNNLVENETFLNTTNKRINEVKYIGNKAKKAKISGSKTCNRKKKSKGK